MKKNLIFLLFILFFTHVYSQEVGSVKIHVLKEEIVVDKLIIKKNTSIDEVVKALGKPERIEQFAGKDKRYIYDSKGIAFSIFSNKPQKTVESVTITFTYDGDKDVAKEKFTGSLLIDSYTVTPESTGQNIKDKTDIDKLECFGKLCASDPQGKGIALMMGLTEENEIMQIVFGFKP